jgi:hypothetical protein
MTISRHLLTAALTFLTLFALSITVKNRARKNQHGMVAEYGWPYKALGAVFMLVFVSMILDVAFGGPRATVKDWRVPALFSPSLLLTLDFFIRKVILTESHIIFISPWSRKRKIPLMEITHVRQLSIAGTYCVSTQKSGDLSLSEELSGSRDLIEMLRKDPIGIGTPLAGCPSLTTVRTDRVYGGSAGEVGAASQGTSQTGR